MNYALIFAGGVGQRMNSKAKPKQFLEIHGRPILIHTVEHFENHPQIDGICLVRVAGWLDYDRQLLEKFNIKKVRWLVAGGDTALRSQYNGLKTMYKSGACGGDDVVLIHDGVRPLINEKLITDCITAVEQYGAGGSVGPAVETVVQTDEQGMICSTIPRSECVLARAPQAFRLSGILQAHETAMEQGKHDFIDSASMMLHHGQRIHTVEGPAENIKVTNPADFYVCRALLDARENLQIYGI